MKGWFNERFLFDDANIVSKNRGLDFQLDFKSWIQNTKENIDF